MKVTSNCQNTLWLISLYFLGIKNITVWFNIYTVPGTIHMKLSQCSFLQKKNCLKVAANSVLMKNSEQKKIPKPLFLIIIWYIFLSSICNINILSDNPFISPQLYACFFYIITTFQPAYGTIIQLYSYGLKMKTLSFVPVFLSSG